MTQKSILVIPEELKRKIDAHRGDLSPADFIDFLIETVLGKEVEEERKAPPPEETEKVAPVAEEEYVTRKEFEDFQRTMKDLQKTFIEFFITYGLELGGKPTSEEERRFREQVRKLLEL